MDKHHLRILIVDDSPEDQETIRRYLKKDLHCEYELFNAYTGEEGLKLFRSERVDCLLLDYRLPDKDGLEFLAEFSDESIQNTVPVVFFTGTGSEEVAVQAMKSGAVDYLVKEKLTSDLLIRTIRYAIEKKRSEEALRNSEELHRSILTSISDTVFITDHTGAFTYVCPNVDFIFGYSVKEIHAFGNITNLLGEGLFELGDLEASGEIKNIECEITDALGKKHILWVNVKRVSINSGTVLYTCRDITRRKQTEQELERYRLHLEEMVEERTAELRKSEEMIRSLMETVPIGIGMSTPGVEGTVTEVNSTLWKLFGYDSKDEFLKMPASAHYHDPKERYQFSKLREHGPVKNYETRFKRKDGTVFWGSVGSITQTTEDGTIRFINTIEDNTERKQAEEKILRQSKVLDGINKVLQEALICESDEEVASTCLRVAEELTGSKFGLIGEVNPAGRFKTIAISNPGWDACKMPESKASRVIKEMEIRGIDRSVIREEKSRIVNDLTAHPDRVGFPEGHPPVTSFLGAPLKRLDKTIGMIGLGNKESGYDPADQEAIEELSIAFVEALTRKRAEIALRESEARFQELFDEAPIGYHELDVKGRITRVNRTELKMMGYSAEEMLGRHIWEFIVEAETARKAIAAKISGAEPTGEAFERTRERKDGTTFPALIKHLLLKDEQGRIIGLRGAIQDITERKQAEKALKKEEEKFRILVEESPLGVSMIGKDGGYKYVNPKFVEMFGYTLEESPTGREWFRKAFPDEKYRNQVISTWINDKKESKTHDPRPREFTVTCKDGSKKRVQFIAVMMETGEEFVIYEDITKREKLEAQLRQAQKMEAIGTLAGGVAHDFNNLLTAIMGNALLMLRNLDKDSPLQEGLNEINESSQRAAALTRQLLAFSRKQIFQRKMLNPNTLISDIKKMLERLIGEDIILDTVLEPDLNRIEADPSQMEQVIMNLVINAGDAMPRGGKITIGTSNAYLDATSVREHDAEIKSGPYTMLSISDTGCGMDEETQAHIFEPFFTTKEQGKGTGLGLSTVYGIVKQSEGYIWCYSEPGQGTIFKIYLPAVEDEARLEQKRTIFVKEVRGSETVFVVEDDRSVRNLTVKALKAFGYIVLEAQNAEEAVSVFEQYKGPVHLVLSDVVMPGMSVVELVDRLRSLSPDIKVIYMSGYTDKTIVDRGVLVQDANFIEKPFTPESLTRKIREVLDSPGDKQGR